MNFLNFDTIPSTFSEIVQPLVSLLYALLPDTANYCQPLLYTSLAAMIRRPPTIISLNDEELQCHLQHAFLRTLPADFNQLHLEDRGQSDDGHTLVDSSPEDGCASSDSDSDFDFTTLPDSTGGSSCIGNGLSSDGTRSLTVPTTLSAAAVTALLHQPSEPNRSPATANQISTIFPPYRTRRSRESPLTISRRELEQYSIGPQDGKKKENCRRSSAQAGSIDHDARLSTSQISRLSPESCSELIISSVPLRGLTLASTESYEAVLADTKASPIVAVDAKWEFGAVQPDSIFEGSCADRGCV